VSTIVVKSKDDSVRAKDLKNKDISVLPRAAATSDAVPFSACGKKKRFSKEQKKKNFLRAVLSWHRFLQVEQQLLSNQILQRDEEVIHRVCFGC
jgi:hypothetical protein